METLDLSPVEIVERWHSLHQASGDVGSKVGAVQEALYDFMDDLDDLEESDPVKMFEVFKLVASHEDPEFREVAPWMLKSAIEVEPVESLKLFRQLLYDHDENVRSEAVAYLHEEFEPSQFGWDLQQTLSFVHYLEDQTDIVEVSVVTETSDHAVVTDDDYVRGLYEVFGGNNFYSTDLEDAVSDVFPEYLDQLGPARRLALLDELLASPDDRIRGELAVLYLDLFVTKANANLIDRLASDTSEHVKLFIQENMRDWLKGGVITPADFKRLARAVEYRPRSRHSER